jgi:hypothetical protein
VGVIGGEFGGGRGFGGLIDFARYVLLLLLINGKLMV